MAAVHHRLMPDIVRLYGIEPGEAGMGMVPVPPRL